MEALERLLCGGGGRLQQRSRVESATVRVNLEQKGPRCSLLMERQ